MLSDVPERILRMAEKQLEHRTNNEKKIVNEEIRASKVGQFLGAFIALACIGGAIFLGMNGHDWLAGIMISIIAAVGTIFVLNKEPNNNNSSI